jgi:excisionase family DNA binding protein
MHAFDEDHLTVAEAASLLRVAPSTVRRWIRDGALPAYRMGKRRLALRRGDVATMVMPIRPESEPNHYVIHTGPSEIRKLTPEEVQRGLDAPDRLKKDKKEIMAQRGGKPLRPSLEIIHEMREERDRQLAEAMGWPADWEKMSTENPPKNHNHRASRDLNSSRAGKVSAA